jgi:hypothetical protein
VYVHCDKYTLFITKIREAIMVTISLLQKTENTTVDALFARVIALFEARFPSRVRGYYLLGSYGDRKAVVGSDIDLSILFKDAGLKPDEKVPAQQIISTCEEMMPGVLFYLLSSRDAR